MTARRYAPAGRREELLSHQVHAAQHYLARHGLAPACSGSFPDPARIASFLCPACGRITTRADWSEDHAPIQAGTFTMGSATTCVITCAPCNNDPGRSYEKSAAANAASPALDLDLPGMTSAVYGRRRVQLHRTLPLYLVREELPFVRTDFRAGFLLAFASLGYEWTTSVGARQAAQALHPDAGPPPPAHGYLMRSTLGPDLNDLDLVLEVAKPAPSIIVRAATGLSVVLPAVGQSTAPRIEGDITVRPFPWPRTAGTGADVDQEHRDGHLFHLDFCDSPDHVGR